MHLSFHNIILKHIQFLVSFIDKMHCIYYYDHGTPRCLFANFQLALYVHICKSHPSTQNYCVYAAWGGWRVQLAS